MSEGRIVKVSGPLVIAEGMRDCNMFDVVRVGNENLIGEILEIHEDRASIQVYRKHRAWDPVLPWFPPWRLSVWNWARALLKISLTVFKGLLRR